MNVIDLLLGEHGTLRHQLAALRLAAPGMADSGLRAAVLGLAEAIESHAAIEDELVFVPLVESGRMPPGPVEAMRAEHRRIDQLFDRILTPAGDRGPDPQQSVALLVETVRHHFDHEEHVLFRIAREILPAPRLAALAEEWAARRDVELLVPVGSAS